MGFRRLSAPLAWEKVTNHPVPGTPKRTPCKPPFPWTWRGFHISGTPQFFGSFFGGPGVPMSLGVPGISLDHAYWWYCWWLKSCTTWDVWNPINNGVNYLSTGAGFQPSTVVFEVNLCGPNIFSSVWLSKVGRGDCCCCVFVGCSNRKEQFYPSFKHCNMLKEAGGRDHHFQWFEVNLHRHSTNIIYIIYIYINAL